jgi:hypothetical protein
MMKIQSLEKVLLEMSLIDDRSLEKARLVQKEKAVPLQDALLSTGVLSDHDMIQALSKQWNISLMNMIGEIDVDPSIIDKLPITFLRKYVMVPVKIQGDTMLVAVNDPTNQEPLFDISSVSLPPNRRFLRPSTDWSR